MPAQAQDIISDEDVQKALTTDKGPGACLVSWTIEDFTQPGDNYVNIVTSVKVKFSLEDREDTVSYVVKANSQNIIMKLTENYGYHVFMKEAGFYMDVVPALNAELAAAGMGGLKVPKCFHVNMEANRERLFLEDLRPRGFQMCNRLSGLDLAHCTLVLEELARLHAASTLLQMKSPEDMVHRYPFLYYDYFFEAKGVQDLVCKITSDALSIAQEMLHTVQGYEDAIKWTAKYKNCTYQLLEKHYSRHPVFGAICHGDCWTNNLLFRYDKEGKPTEVMLVDLQVQRMASLGSDLAYFLYTSLHGEVRRANLDLFLTTYYGIFSQVMQGSEGGGALPFTLQELRQEFNDNQELGLLFGNWLLLLLHSPANDTGDIGSNRDEKLPEEAMVGKYINVLENDSGFRSRFLATFNDTHEFNTEI